MTVLWIVCVTCLLLTIGATVAAVKSFDRDNESFMVPGAVAFVLFIATVVFGAMLVSVHFDRVSCRTFARQTNRTTRFIFYNSFSWDCLAKESNGKWIPTKNLREFGSR